MSLLTAGVLVLAITANGLIAGVFFGFTCAVLPGLQHVADRAFIDVFCRINVAILNAGFLVLFVAAPAATISALALSQHSLRGVLIAAVAGSIASVLITAAANVPLNRELDRAPSHTPEDCRSARAAFEAPWRRWHLIRTGTSAVAVVMCAVAGVG